MRVATLRARLSAPVGLASRVLMVVALIAPVYLLSTHSSLWANAAGPPDAAPPSCSCHGSDAVKATVEITGLPATFTPGTAYTLTVKVSDPDRTVAAPDVPAVRFWAAGNSANNDGATTGDHIAQISPKVSRTAVVAVRRSSWTRVKAGYR